MERARRGGGGVLMVLLVLTRQSHPVGRVGTTLWPGTHWMSLDARRPHPHQSLRSPLGKVEEAQSRNAGGPTAPRAPRRRPRRQRKRGHSNRRRRTPPPRHARRIFTHPGRRVHAHAHRHARDAPRIRDRRVVSAHLGRAAISAGLRHPVELPAQHLHARVHLRSLQRAINVFFAGFLLPRLAVLWRYAPRSRSESRRR